MGADGPGKAEVAVEELARATVFCDDWEQASHGGELAAAVEAGVVRREDVTQLGDVLAGDAEGRTSDDEITLFDSTGLAIQDLAIATRGRRSNRQTWTCRRSTSSRSSGQGERAGSIGGRSTYASLGSSVATSTEAPWAAAAGSTRYWILLSGRSACRP